MEANDTWFRARLEGFGSEFGQRDNRLGGSRLVVVDNSDCGAARPTHSIAWAIHQRNNHRFIPFNFCIIDRCNREVSLSAGRERAGGGQLLEIGAVDGGTRKGPSDFNWL